MFWFLEYTANYLCCDCGMKGSSSSIYAIRVKATTKFSNNNDYENSREKEGTENPTAEIRLATHDNGGMNIIAFK